MDHVILVEHFHVLTGSHASYVRSLLAIASSPVSKGGLGYRGIVVNSRGCMFSLFSL